MLANLGEHTDLYDRLYVYLVNKPLFKSLVMTEISFGFARFWLFSVIVVFGLLRGEVGVLGADHSMCKAFQY